MSYREGPLKSMIMEDVQRLVREWVRKARADAKATGQHPPPPLSRMPKYAHEPLFREARYWHALAAGAFLDELVEPRPSAFHIKAMRRHLAGCTERLHEMMNSRGNALPAGAREQLGVIEQRVGVALDLVEQTGTMWGCEAAYAWLELTWWARKLHYGRVPGTPEPWNPNSASVSGRRGSRQGN
ncbi:hypothetical protein [Streptomyces sp. 769]|uniref:hypothetical protein n=1 Tax=Streptomyces sp. 769 TaxID=1262452 RepID=UPI00057DA6BB|nr:hypothetical protein [Streptomyces sp. 769]AJC60490.1 hypothetical protein GZL_07942 [Streptomyces sp. 769]